MIGCTYHICSKNLEIQHSFNQSTHSEIILHLHTKVTDQTIASSDPNVITSPHKRCSIYTEEKKFHDITNPKLDKIVLH